uniref:Uncharacterized protein n=1 Tax=Timspurckia oligopyrenoides TaxID=708627 RepID=A0A7S0ZFB6_9RHOD|mmetsp:Transcript_3123/g.5495  ORF Transcript_3123/g.5495 Transcript_3123/m.5495 type:complete len:200 (+) Transcript_3123:39-638(+)
MGVTEGGSGGGSSIFGQLEIGGVNPSGGGIGSSSTLPPTIPSASELAFEDLDEEEDELSIKRNSTRKNTDRLGTRSESSQVGSSAAHLLNLGTPSSRRASGKLQSPSGSDLNSQNLALNRELHAVQKSDLQQRVSGGDGGENGNGNHDVDDTSESNLGSMGSMQSGRLKLPVGSNKEKQPALGRLRESFAARRRKKGEE